MLGNKSVNPSYSAGDRLSLPNTAYFFTTKVTRQISNYTRRQHRSKSWTCSLAKLEQPSWKCALRSGWSRSIAILANAEMRLLHLALMLDGSRCWVTRASTQSTVMSDRTWSLPVSIQC